MIHLISLIVSFVRWLEKQSREEAVRAGRAPAPVRHSVGEAPMPARPPAHGAQRTAVPRLSVPPPAPRPGVMPQRPHPAHLVAKPPTIVDSSPRGFWEWLMHRNERGA